MTRNDILTQYDVDANGIIRTLGKFEAEMLYAPYFYDAMLNGDGDSVNGVDYFVLDADDKREFPELADYYGVCMEESEQGFIYMDAMNEKDFKRDMDMQSRFGYSEQEIEF